jgi:hypothetical protein
MLTHSSDEGVDLAVGDSFPLISAPPPTAQTTSARGVLPSIVVVIEGGPNDGGADGKRFQQQKWTAQRFRLFGLGAAGAWLVIVIVIAVCLAIIIFSASQFQSRLASLTLNGGPLTIWKAEPLREQWRNSRQLLEVATTVLVESQKRRAEAVTKRDRAGADAASALVYAKQTHLELVNKVALKDADLAQQIRAPAGLEIDVVNKLRSGPLQQMADNDSQIAEALNNFVTHFEFWKFKEGSLKSLEDQVASLDETVKEDQKNFEAAKSSAQLVIPAINGQTPDEAQRVQIENAIYEFEAVHSLLWGLVYKFSLQPSDFLVLVLVIVMGVLGSSLQLSYIYVNEFGSRNISFYVFRPFLGVLTALVVFIVTKAGVPLVTDTSKLGGNAPINPYFISFIAIISGLLSERALAALREIGSGYFRGSEGEPRRWARDGLRDLFKAMNRDPLRLKAVFDMQDKDLNEWIDGKTPVPPDVQRLIAAVLDRPRRDLFTDIAPPDANATED